MVTQNRWSYIGPTVALLTHYTIEVKIVKKMINLAKILVYKLLKTNIWIYQNSGLRGIKQKKHVVREG